VGCDGLQSCGRVPNFKHYDSRLSSPRSHYFAFTHAKHALKTPLDAASLFAALGRTWSSPPRLPRHELAEQGRGPLEE
jgi:hypothetical protein